MADDEHKKSEGKLSGDFEGDATETLMHAIERMRSRLHEATVNAPPRVYQAIERLRELAHERVEHTEQRISNLAHELGENEEDLLEWLKLDIRTLEKRLVQSLLSTTDASRVELQQWLHRVDEEEEESKSAD